VVATDAALRRRAGYRDPQAWARLCARAHVEFGGLHRRHVHVRPRRRPLRPALGALCRPRQHRLPGALRLAAAGGRAKAAAAARGHTPVRVGELLRQRPFLLS
jgi:hypothetical protein